MRLFRFGKPRKPELGQIETWAAAMLGDDRLTIRAHEVSCPEPGCPPVETVVMILSPTDPTWQVKLPKPAEALSEEELRSSLAAHAPDRTG